MLTKSLFPRKEDLLEQINVYVGNELHKKIKAIAVHQKTTMSVVVKEALEYWLKNYGNQKYFDVLR